MPQPSSTTQFWQPFRDEIVRLNPFLQPTPWPAGVSNEMNASTYGVRKQGSPERLVGWNKGRHWSVFWRSDNIEGMYWMYEFWFRGCPPGAEQGRLLPYFYLGVKPGLLGRGLIGADGIALNAARRDLPKDAFRPLPFKAPWGDLIAVSSYLPAVKFLVDKGWPQTMIGWYNTLMAQSTRKSISPPAFAGFNGVAILSIGTPSDILPSTISSVLNQLFLMADDIEVAFGGPTLAASPPVVLQAGGGTQSFGRRCPTCGNYELVKAVYEKGILSNERTLGCRALVYGQRQP